MNAINLIYRNEELQHDIAMSMRNCYIEVLTDANKLLQQLEENDGSITEVWIKNKSCMVYNVYVYLNNCFSVLL